MTGYCTPAYEALMCPNMLSQGHLVPSDEITVYYSSQPAGEYLDQVIQAHTDFILATTKAPLKPYPVAQNASVIVQEKTQVTHLTLRCSDTHSAVGAHCSSTNAPIPTFDIH